MLSPQDISALLGVAAPGTSTNQDPEMFDCSWDNPTTQESISVHIGNPGTARNNTLPPPEPGFPDPTTPGPDGMCLMGGGAIEFAAGNRSNTVQVAVLKLSADQANWAAIDLARKITPRGTPVDVGVCVEVIDRWAFSRRPLAATRRPY